MEARLMGGSVKKILKAALVVAAVATGIAFIPGIGAITTGAFTKGAVAYFATQTLVAGTLGLISSALSPTPSAPSAADLQGRTLSRRNPLATRKVIYGEVRVGGTETFLESAAGQKNIHQIITFAGHEVSAVTEVLFADSVVKNNPLDSVRYSPNSGTTPNYSSVSKITVHMGGANQTADSDLVSETGVDGNFRQRGCAYIYVRHTADQDVFINGMPNVSLLVQGKPVLDPRTGLIVYSNNPALCIRDYLTSYLKVPANEIDDNLFIIAANICDETITLSGGGTEKRYTLNGVIDLKDTPKAILEQLKTSCAAQIFEANGEWKIRVGKYIEPVSSITLDDLRGPIKVDTRVSGRNQFNAVKGIFVSPETNWQPTNFPETSSTVFESEDGGERKYADITLPFTTSSATAQRLSKQALYRNREQITVTLPCKLTAFKYLIGDTVKFTNPRFGWDEKVFEVIGWKLVPVINDSGTTLGVDLALKETSAAIYEWDGSIDEKAFTYNNTNLASPFDATPPTITSTTEALYTTSNSKGVQVRATLNWTQPLDSFAREYEAGYKLSGATDWIFIARTSALSAEVDDIRVGSYDFRVRSISALGRRSIWATIYNAQFAGKTAPPSNVTGFSVRALDGQAHISWNRVSDLDVLNGGFFRIRHTPNTSTATWDGAQDIGEQLSGTQTHAVLPLLSGTYLIKAVDSTGNFSVLAAAAVTNVANILNFNVIKTISEHIAFAGIKSNMVSTDGVLQLTSDGVNTPESGTYDFEQITDLGNVFVSRVSAIMEASSSSISDTIDSRTTLMDTWANFDGVPSDKVSAVVQIRTAATVGDWSEWAPVLVGDYRARYLQFRLIVANQEPTYNIFVSRLLVTVDMPDRTESGISLAVPAQGVTVSFQSAFSDPPAVVATLNGGVSGDFFDITAVNNSTFNIQCKSSSGAGVARTVNWHANGFGRVV
jgi:hypothetical protein